jgi:hypothetical protein
MVIFDLHWMLTYVSVGLHPPPKKYCEWLYFKKNYDDLIFLRHQLTYKLR